MVDSTRALNDKEFMLQLEELIALVSEARQLLGHLDLEAEDDATTAVTHLTRPN